MNLLWKKFVDWHQVIVVDILVNWLIFLESMSLHQRLVEINSKKISSKIMPFLTDLYIIVKLYSKSISS
jgi:hypothetical protein